jgi:hypothetical protein
LRPRKAIFSGDVRAWAVENWLHAQLPRISGKSELAKAIRYALARMRKLRPYLDHGCLEGIHPAGAALRGRGELGGSPLRLV